MDQSVSQYLTSGLQAHREQRLEDAALAYQAALRLTPDSFDALQLLGMLRHQQGRIREARALLEQALQTRPGHPGASNTLTAILLAAGEPEDAAALARSVLAGSPDDSLALYHLACALRMLGQSSAASDALERSLAVRPGKPDASNLLGILRHEQGRFSDAAVHFENALRARPGHPEYLNNLGFALLEDGRPGAARAVLEQAVAARSGFGEALVNLGRALHQLGLDAEAIRAFGEARKIDPGVAAVHLNLGISLQALGRTGEARQAYLAAIDRRPDSVSALAHLAALFESENELDNAEETVGRGLAAAPADPFLKLVAAKCARRRGDCAAAKARVTEALASSPGDKWSQALFYELARIEDRAGAYPAAMAAADSANQIALRDWQTAGSENAYNSMLDRLGEATADGWIERWAPLPERDVGAPPVFLVGFPRSGTTLLDTIIGSHPDYRVLEEKPVIEALRLTLDQQPGGYLRALGALDEAGRASLVARYWDEAEDLLGEPRRQRRLLDKLPLNILMLPLIKRVFPDAPIILALRHPADVCLSCYFQEFDYRQSPAMANFLSLPDTVAFYGKVMRLWQEFECRLALSVHTVRYEELVHDTEGVARRLFAFLGSDWDPRVLDYHRTVRKRGIIDTPSYHQVSQPIYTRARYRWRHYEAELAPWLPTLQNWALQLGYERPAAEPANRGNRDD